MDCDRSGSSIADMFCRKVPPGSEHCYPKPQKSESHGKAEEMPAEYYEDLISNLYLCSNLLSDHKHVPSQTDSPKFFMGPESSSLEIGGEAEEMPPYDEEEEERLAQEEIDKSEGFDIDFSKFRCCSGYHPVEPNGDWFTEGPDTDWDLVGSLSELALQSYNEKKGTDLEVENVVKANWHPSAGYTFYITFQATDPLSSDSEPKAYQTKLRHLPNIDTEIAFCRPKPYGQGVEEPINSEEF